MGLTSCIPQPELIVSKTDITRSLQHKQELYSKSNEQHDLSVDLDAADDADRLSTGINRVDALVEPSPTLPLWRRVDRQFWWNEWLTKPFVEAGVSVYVDVGHRRSILNLTSH